MYVEFEEGLGSLIIYSKLRLKNLDLKIVTIMINRKYSGFIEDKKDMKFLR